MSVILKMEEQAHLVEGFVIGDENIIVSHLQFADNIILSLKANRECLKHGALSSYF